jgi:hypothetical protein
VTTEFSGTTLYGRFQSNAILDGRVVEISTTYNQTASEIAIILPHFFDTSGIYRLTLLDYFLNIFLLS